MVGSTLGIIACWWVLIALFDARRREILGWDVVESEMWGDRNVRPRYRGIVATERQARNDRDYWTLEQREDNFTSSRNAGRIYALMTGFLRAPFLFIGFVVWVCWQPFRPLMALLFLRPKSTSRAKTEGQS